MIAAFNDGGTPEEIVQQYDVLPLADVYAVISYYLEDQSEVDAYISQYMPIGQAIEEIVLLAECSLEGEWERTDPLFTPQVDVPFR